MPGEHHTAEAVAAVTAISDAAGFRFYFDNKERHAYDISRLHIYDLE